MKLGRTGPWNGGGFTGILTTTNAHFYGFQGGNDREGNINVYFIIQINKEFITYILGLRGIKCKLHGLVGFQSVMVMVYAGYLQAVVH
ncbi:hypothetical protein MtrunA17_Chr7g0236671 [Medicago truncatula]|uniref:Transmembrane protein n=1 Tax=Medicago truncatula TaxID=3880 RepID=A0A396H0C6_MEDTR|nr:hypothetical protein MtrunA17_Chr7g0236671 [Medicago truncatula]